MFTAIASDMRRKAELYGLTPGPRAVFRMCFSEGSTAQILYRAMQYCQNHRMKLLAILLYRLNTHLGHVVIGRGATFGPGLVIMHSFGIIVHGQVKAGKNLSLEAGVVIGENEEQNQIPTLGDNVSIGAGAKIIGPVTIGSDVKIGANAVVTRDIPDGATAVGIPARVIKLYGKKIASEAGAVTAGDAPAASIAADVKISGNQENS